MTRFLSDSLQAPEPFFRQGLRRLEAANGAPNTDIRVSVEVMQAARSKLKQLGLDPADTTPEELYYVLQTRLKADDVRLVKNLRTLAARYVSAEGDVVAGMIHALKQLPDSKRCFALKPSSLKAIFKQNPPKKAMKQLGYRSLDSFLKHEAPAALLAAAHLYEGTRWQQRLSEQYKKLRSGDFEDRNIVIVQLSSGRWQRLAKEAVAASRHNLLSFKELGALVFLPLPADAPAGTVTASLSLGLHELNEIRASSTYLKLCQVRADFGSLVQTVAADEPYLSSQVLDMPLPWHLVQRYYAQLKNFGSHLAEPHLDLEDIAWHPVEKTMAAIEPALAFWQDSAHLGVLRGRQPVSLNLMDTALNTCNQLPFERRMTHYFQRSLWHEMLLRYLKPEVVERSVLHELQPQLAEAMAEA